MGKENSRISEDRKLRTKAEKKLKKQIVKLQKKSSSGPEKVLHELRVHQIELEMQNEELRQTQQELEATRNKYTDLYDFAPVGYFTFDKKGMVVEANLTGCQMLGVERKNLIGKPFSLFVDKGSQDAFYLHRQAVIKTAVRQTCEISLVRKNKTTLDVLLRSIVASSSEGGDNKGELTLCRTAVTDINEQRRAEKAAKQGKERYGSLTIATTQMVWTTDASGRVVDDIPTWRAFTGQSVEEIKDWGWLNSLHPDDRKRTQKIWSQAVKTRSIYQTEYRVMRYDGEYRYLSVHGVPVLEQDGSIREWVGTCMDITERKATEEKQAITNSLLEPFVRRKSRKEYLDSTVAVLRDWSGCEFIGIRVKDNDGNIPYGAHVNFDKDFLALENDLNLDRDNCVCVRAIREHPPKQEQNFISPGGSFYCNDSQAFLNGLTELQKKDYRGNCLKWGFKSISVVPVRYRDEVLGAIHLADYKINMVPLSKIQFIETTIAPLISEALHRFNAELELEKYRLHLEEMVKQQTDELMRSNQDLEQFAYIASHDLKEPLRAIRGFMDLLHKVYKDKLDEKAIEYIRYSTDGAKRMDDLLTCLMQYSRVQTHGKDFKPVPAQGALSDALANLQQNIEETGACITSDELPMVLADGIQITQLFQNLIGNAVKFRSYQKPQIHVGCQKQKNCWQFSVRDNGIGIDPQFNERIFLIFQRLHTRDKYPGYGIGLSICKRIVERHGGRIWLELQQGQGSTFCFTIPS